ncbi:NADPH-dependent oxidoreductase [Beijerinckia indica]|uniref:Nitroreductase n=1 Tax=Beijerinckia indica subsp. indica (strain ATCC 9039 / DSM 1715 / NCIMB 8712) TaxID=395963 RepID=B2IDP0_BEII9|nr:NADPH-dependent oxidoreductase [Beijerinckia indica]ACB95476.1 nitroreductase [Beijerinckia indica subsp. indica ATCC 9039]
MTHTETIDRNTIEEKSDRTLHDLIFARYRQPVETGTVALNPVLEAILSHRSVRDYLPTPLPQGALETIVAAAQSASTSSNLQAWSVVAVKDPDRRARLAALSGHQRQIVQAPLFLVWLADLSRLRAIAKGLDRTSEGLDYIETFLLAVIDATLAAQNAVVALESLGLGSCYIGGIRNQPEAVAAELRLPPETIAIFGLTVGYPDPDKPAEIKPRLSQNIVLHHELYGEEHPAAPLDLYNATLRIFQAEQNLSPIDWTDQATSRISTADALKGRQLLTDVIRALGFALK